MMKTYSRKKKSSPASSSASFQNSSTPANLPSSKRPPVDDEVEAKHFRKVVKAFKFYRQFLLNKFQRNKQLVESLPEHQQRLLKSYTEGLVQIEGCLLHNQMLINRIIEDVDNMFENTDMNNDDPGSDDEKPSVMDIERVQTTLKQFVRDWSKEGQGERKACYQPIIDEITKNFPPNEINSQDINILVPGSGLGRLAFEISHLGYTCQGNEFSLFMLIASNFVLNKCSENMFSVYPWVHQVDNNLNLENQTQKVDFPDVNPKVLRDNAATFSMAAGDFMEIYNDSESWHSIATCFFIDCANNIVDFIEKIYDILKPGGVWINLGPLLYHYSNIPGEFSIEPPYSVVKEIITGVGFLMEKEEIGVKTKYGQNPHSMLQYEYNSVFFVCRKPIVIEIVA